MGASPCGWRAHSGAPLRGTPARSSARTCASVCRPQGSLPIRICQWSAASWRSIRRTATRSPTRSSSWRSSPTRRRSTIATASSSTTSASSRSGSTCSFPSTARTSSASRRSTRCSPRSRRRLPDMARALDPNHACGACGLFGHACRHRPAFFFETSLFSGVIHAVSSSYQR